MIKNFKLFNLKLVHSRLNLDESLKINNISLLALAIRIKKALKIIHNYHICKKRIIFIGNPLYANQQLSNMLKKSKHIFIPRSAWIAGHITNKFTRTKKLKSGFNQTKLFSIHKLKNKSSLVVIIDELRDYIALNEHHKQSIPAISLNSETKMLNITSAFKIPAKLLSLKSEVSISMFYSLLLSVLKASHKKKYIYYKTHLTRKQLKMDRYLATKRKRTFSSMNFLKTTNNFSKHSIRNKVASKTIKPFNQ